MLVAVKIENIQNINPNEDIFEYRIVCPVCEKRVFDVSELSSDCVFIRLKCPHCRKVVKIPIFVSAR